MSDHPDPLTPPDCDLRDYPWMPLAIPQLMQSRGWMKCRRKPELAFYVLNLRMAAWHALPAASLEDDDEFLCDLAMCDPARWPEVREEVLRVWVKCADGRLYHPDVATEANEAWQRKLACRSRTRAATAARKAKRNVTSNVTSNVTKNATSTLRSPPDQTVPDKNASSLHSEPSSLASYGDKSPSEAQEAAGPSPKRIASPLRVHPDEVAPPLAPVPIRNALWRDGLPIIRSLTGLSERQARAFLGRLLRESRDDCARLYGALREAEDLQPVEPKAWLTAACRDGPRRSRAAPSKFGFFDAIVAADGGKILPFAADIEAGRRRV